MIEGPGCLSCARSPGARLLCRWHGVWWLFILDHVLCADAVLLKPFDPDRLFAEAQRLLGP